MLETLDIRGRFNRFMAFALTVVLILQVTFNAALNTATYRGDFTDTLIGNLSASGLVDCLIDPSLGACTTEVLAATTGVVGDVGSTVIRNADKIADDASDLLRNADKGGIPAKIKDLSESNITNSGETVLGHFPGYIDKANSRGASYFDIGDAWNDLTPDQRWAANTNFLDKIAQNGDTVNLSLPKTQIRPESYLQQEVDYLTQNKGYTWVNQWTLKPPSGN